MSNAFSPANPICHVCGEPTFTHDLVHADELTAEAIALLGISARGHACRGCVDRAERELDADDEALALDGDPAFAAICDERAESYLAHAMAHQGVDADLLLAAVAA